MNLNNPMDDPDVREDLHTAALDADEKRRVEAVRSCQSRFHNIRAKLWCDVLLRGRNDEDSVRSADNAVLLFDKRFSAQIAQFEPIRIPGC